MSANVYQTVDEKVFVTATHRYYNTSPTCSETGSSTTPSTEQLCRSWKYSSAAGWNTPGWRKMKNDGIILPMTPWTRFTLDANVNLGTRVWCDSANYRHKWEDWYHSKYPSIEGWTSSYLMGLIDPYDLEYYVQKAAASIYTSGWDAATFIAEIAQLRKMLSGVGKKINDLASGRSPGELYNLWLEGRYGWRTLMYDIKDLHEVLSRVNERRTRYRQAVGASDGGLYTTYTDATSSNLTVRYSTSVSWATNMRGTVVADIDVPDYQFNPVTTAWEVTKLSFVVDWLINVGQALEAASFLLKAKAYQACGGVRVDFNMSGNAVLLSQGVNTYGSVNQSWSGTAAFIERIPMSVSSLPRLKLRLDAYKVIDLLALVAQRLR
jgi:hypothetical protein